MIVDPRPSSWPSMVSPAPGELERERLARLRHTPAVTIDGQKIELLANIEQPDDAPAAVKAGAGGRGPVPQNFFHGQKRQPAG